MPAADLVLRNANIITMDPAKPVATLVAVSGDRIGMVGTDVGLESIVDRQTRIIDCAGRTLAPGFNDAHCHIMSLVRKLLSLDLSPASVGSIADVKAAIRRQAAATPQGQWISATGLNDFYLAEKRLPNRWELDEAAPGHPVVLSHRSLHACVLNSRALERAGIGVDSEEPPGATIERDLATGEPNGILYEMLGYIREKVMAPLSGEEFAEGVARANELYLSRGLTSLQDASITNDLSRWRTLKALRDSGKLQSRVDMMAGEKEWPSFREAGMRTGWGDEGLRVGPVKVMLGNDPTRLREGQAELNEKTLATHRAGFQLAFHANHFEAIESAIDAIEYAQKAFPIAGRRHRIEHGSECSDRLLERMAALNMSIATQPPFVYYSGERYLATVPKERQPMLYRFGAMFKAGLTVAASSDSPVVDNNPLVGIYAAVSRKTEGGHSLLPQESVSAAQALAMYTLHGARVSRENAIKGSIAPGKLADMVLLSADPTREDTEAIKDIRVVMTVVGGRVVWEG